MINYLKATKGDKSIGMEELSDDVFCKEFHLIFPFIVLINVLLNY